MKQSPKRSISNKYENLKSIDYIFKKYDIHKKYIINKDSLIKAIKELLITESIDHNPNISNIISVIESEKIGNYANQRIFKSLILKIINNYYQN